jgi:hypothetical protein
MLQYIQIRPACKMTSLAFGDPVVKSGIFWNVLRIWVYHTNILLLILVMKSARAEGAEA